MAYEDIIAILQKGPKVWNASQADRNLHSPPLSLRGISLEGWELSGFLFNIVDLSEANLRGCILKETGFSDVDLTGSDLEGADLSRASLQHVHFSEARLRGARLASASGTELSFDNADLREADLSQVHFSSPKFMMADLSEANLTNAVVEGGNFTEASLKYANLSAADFSGANLEGADLRGAILHETNLKDASMYRTVPDKPDLSAARNVPSSQPKKEFGLCAPVGGGGGGGYHDPPDDQSTAVRVRVYYVTDRIPEDQADRRHFYGIRDTDKLSYGTCEVSIPERKRIGEIPRPSLWRLEFRENLKRHVVLLTAEPMDCDDFYASMSSHGPHAFLFVHGYKVSFEDAARRTAQIAYDLSFDGVPIFYSWASRATLRDYPADLASNARTWHRLAECLSKLADCGSFERIHLISHSMGGRAVCQSALQMVQQPVSRVPVFKNVIFAAPDVEVPVFRNAISRLTQLAGRFTLYFSTNDFALRLSRRFNSCDRTGEKGIVARGLDTIDASAIEGDMLAHSYWGERTVLSDISELLKGDRSPRERFGMQCVQTPEGEYFELRP